MIIYPKLEFNKIIKAFIISFFVLIFIDGYGQCANQVTHINGSKTVNKVAVTVSSSGFVDTFPEYCKTFPYFIGKGPSSINGKGSYTFNFSPAVNSITLNFTGISHSAKYKEEVVIYVNDKHYRIPSAGGPTDCEPMALLNSNGNIIGCFDCAGSGWYGTTISGPIYELTVLDSVISGTPNGTVFSLFICESASITDFSNATYHNYFIPNPFSAKTTFLLPKTINNVEVLLFNAQGKLVNPKYCIENSVLILDRENLSSGIYYYRINSNSNIIEAGKLMIY